MRPRQSHTKPFAIPGFITIAGALMLLALGVAVVQAQQTNPRPIALFAEDGGGTAAREALLAGSQVPDEALDAAQRVRAVDLNAEAIQPGALTEGDVLYLGLFDDVRLWGDVEQVTENIPGMIGVRGSIQDAEYGSFTLSISEGRVLGVVTLPALDQEYKINYLGQEIGHVVQDIDPARKDVLESGPAPILEDPQLNRNIPFLQGLPQGSADAQATIDLMIVYTPAARQWAAANATSINHVISQVMQLGQQALDNSQIGATLNLVHSAEVNYTESGDSGTDLDRLTFHAGYDPWNYEGSTRYMDEVHTWRDTYGADVVTMLARVEDVGGLGWLLDQTSGRPQLGFNLNRVQQSHNTYTVIHEIGHNAGAHHHAQQNFQPGPGLHSYSAGWRWTGNDGQYYCSVMTYEEGSYFSDGRTHRRVPYFSSPSISYQGAATGHSTLGDNARTLINTKSVLAAYRSSSSTSQLGDALDATGLSWSTSGNANWRVDTGTAYYGGSSARSGSIGHSQSSCLSTTVTGPGTLSFYWKVSSESTFDLLKLKVNGVTQRSISGEVGWTQVQQSLSSGSQNLQWCYEKDSSVSVGSDAGWVDRVSFVAGTVTPPAAPTAYPATGVSSTGFTANWSAVTGATAYYLDVARDSGFSQLVSGYSNRAVGNVTQFAVTGLSTSTPVAVAGSALMMAETSPTSQPATPVRSDDVIGPGVRDAVRQAASGSAAGAGAAIPPLVVFLDDGMGGQAATAASAAAAVSNVQTRVLSAMQVSGDRGPGLHVRHRFTHLPVLTVEITDTQTLDRLASQPEVIRIDLDVGGSGSMNQVVPLVGADVAHASGATGRGVTVAVIDSGIARTHADFSGALLREECFGYGTDSAPLCDNGTARQSGTGSATDRHGHGTHVSGIIAGRGTVAPTGMAPGARLVAIKALDDNGVFASFTENVVAPLDWIIANHATYDIRLVNASLGTYDRFGSHCDNSTAWTMAGATAVNRLRSLGVAVIAAAGNDSDNAMGAPGCLSNVISVGASDNLDRAASFTNASSTTDVFAPGVSVLSSSVSGSTTRMSGTSMASPVVAGCAALLLGAEEVSTPAALETRLKTSTRMVSAFGRSYPRIQCDIQQEPPPSSTFYYRVRAANSAGTSSNSNVIEVSDSTSGGNFSELYYRARNPDVATAINQGWLGTGWQHYQFAGQAEGRSYAMPTDYGAFNEVYYLASNPDVARVVNQGLLGTGWQHWQAFGQYEGRSYAAPAGYGSFNEAYYLARNPDVAIAVNQGVFGTGWQHYQAFGVAEGRSYAMPVGYGDFNETYYLARNPDVAIAVNRGVFGTGWQHWQLAGQAEGRSYTRPDNY